MSSAARAKGRLEAIRSMSSMTAAPLVKPGAVSLSTHVNRLNAMRNNSHRDTMKEVENLNNIMT